MNLSFQELMLLQGCLCRELATLAEARKEANHVVNDALADAKLSREKLLDRVNSQIQKAVTP